MQLRSVHGLQPQDVPGVEAGVPDDEERPRRLYWRRRAPNKNKEKHRNTLEKLRNAKEKHRNTKNNIDNKKENAETNSKTRKA